MANANKTGIGRRKLLQSAGLLAGTSAAGIPLATAASDANSNITWDAETDVICVGSGAAACSAAVTARAAGAEVIVLEKLPLLGGTTGKSGGVTWIPNNRFLRAAGIDDRKEDCLQYLARYAYPQEYYADSPTLGLRESDYKLLAAFYDNGAKMIDFLHDNNIVNFRQFRMWDVDTLAPDYADHLPENKVPRGRALEPASGAGSSEGGGSLAATMANWLEANGATLQTDSRVTDVIMDGERVTGVTVEVEGSIRRYRARKAVIFGSGGYAHNTDLISLHQTSLCGSCAMPGSTGDFIDIANKTGARLGALQLAWRTQVVFEEALEHRAVGLGAFVLPGDSMIVVNRYGKRITNEKRNYNDRTRTHFYWDPIKEEYPNQLQFMVFDQRSLDAFGGAFPFPNDPRSSRHLIKGESWDELSNIISARLEKLAAKSGSFSLDKGFHTQLVETISRFNGYARTGVDTEFSRGKYAYDADWHKLFSARREGTEYPENDLPSLVMYPFTDQGPYYAFILAAGALDTCGGPVINEYAQVMAVDGTPIAGLYGAGNCISSPTRQAYAGAGGTIGLALTFGHIAANHALGS